MVRGADTIDVRDILNQAVTWDKEECLIWPHATSSGYAWHEKFGRVHRFICKVAHGRAPTAKHEVAHSCGNGTLGCIAGNHLRWATHSENMMDAVKHGTHGTARLSEEDVREIRKLYKDGVSYLGIATRFEISARYVQKIVSGRARKWIGEEEEYGETLIGIDLFK